MYGTFTSPLSYSLGQHVRNRPVLNALLTSLIHNQFIAKLQFQTFRYIHRLTGSPMLTFELFRFQLLPISQHQQELFSQPYSAEVIREKKNAFFDEVLQHLPSFRHRGMRLRHKVELHVDDLFIFKLGTHKSVDRDTPEFRRERIESWPNVTVILDNNPDSQIIAISKNHRAFSSGSSVAKLIERTLTQPLKSYGLTIQVREQFEKNSFWETINQFDGMVSRVRFEMVAPNMANISKVLRVDLKQLNRESNAQKTSLELEAVDGAALEIREDNQLINGCVDYASAGGGDISIKIRGMKREIRTSTTVKTISIEEAILEAPAQLMGEASEQVAHYWLDALKKLLSQ
jgi:hypothetical protein